MERPDTAAAREQIAEIIGKSVYQALGLLETLDAEHDALETQNMNALQTSLEQKGGCVRKLRGLEQERNAACSAAGFPTSPDQMDHFVAWCDEDSVLASSWDHLMDISIKCNTRNITNGAIIHGRKQQIEASLAVIRGGEPAANTYNRSGRDTGAANMRSITEV